MEIVYLRNQPVASIRDKCSRKRIEEDRFSSCSERKAKLKLLGCKCDRQIIIELAKGMIHCKCIRLRMALAVLDQSFAEAVFDLRVHKHKIVQPMHDAELDTTSSN